MVTAVTSQELIATTNQVERGWKSERARQNNTRKKKIERVTRAQLGLRILIYKSARFPAILRHSRTSGYYLGETHGGRRVRSSNRKP